MAARPNYPLAAAITVAGCDEQACGCGAITLRLHDRSGAIFAAAQMPPETAVGLVEQLTDLLEQYAGGELAKALCVGSA